MYRTLLKYLKKHHIDIYAILLEEELKNKDYAFYYDIKNKKLFQYNISKIEKYYKKNYKDFSWNIILIEIYLYDTKNIDIKIYKDYNNFLSVKKLKKIINNNLYYRKAIKECLRDDIKKESNKDKKKKFMQFII